MAVVCQKADGKFVKLFQREQRFADDFQVDLNYESGSTGG